MGNVEKDFAKGKPIYVGIDVHKRDWVLTVLSQGEEVDHATVVPDHGAFVRLLKRFEASEVHTVYEAGPTGYWSSDFDGLCRAARSVGERRIRFGGDSAIAGTSHWWSCKD